MNRRDMIIVAVLMNVGLLAILFMMAIHTDDGGVALDSAKANELATTSAPQTILQPVEAPQTAVSLPRTSPHDEIDAALTAYSAGVVQAPVVIDETLMREPKRASIPTEVVRAPTSQEPDFVDVTVKRGDSLDKIARANSTTIKALRQANALKTDRLQIGQVLRVPVGAKTAVASTTKNTTATVSSVSAEYYTIKNGDNPWKIAKQFHVRFDELLKLNNLNEEKARRLKAGDRIRVR